MKKDTRITIRLTKELSDDLEKVCAMTGLDAPTIIRACIDAFVERAITDGEIRLPLAVVPKSSLAKEPMLRVAESPESVIYSGKSSGFPTQKKKRAAS